MNGKTRKIIHVDMDAFFASVEQRDNPDLKGKPVAVGGSRERGVVAAASYEARKFGVFSAMPSVTAQRLCPNIIFVPHRFDVYKEVSRQIREIFLDYTDLVEPLSLDEAFLDVTRNKKDRKSATRIAHEIRQRIKEETHLTASAGISVNKFLAKVASDLHKPDGLTLIPPDKIDEFIAALPIKKFFGIGKVTASKMASLNINTGKDLRRYTRPELVRMFGKAGGYYFNISRGVDNRPVVPDRDPKSISVESTFEVDLTTVAEMLPEIGKMALELSIRLQRRNIQGKTITIKIKDNEFQSMTRSKTIEEFTNEEAVIMSTCKLLLEEENFEKSIRLLGVGVSKLDIPQQGEHGQLTLDF